MVPKQSMTQVIMQSIIKAAKATITAVREMEIPVIPTRPVPTMPKNEWSCTKAAHFTGNLQTTPRTFNTEIKVMNFYLTNSCNIQESENVPIIMK